MICSLCNPYYLPCYLFLHVLLWSFWLFWILFCEFLFYIFSFLQFKLWFYLWNCNHYHQIFSHFYSQKFSSWFLKGSEGNSGRLVFWKATMGIINLETHFYDQISRHATWISGRARYGDRHPWGKSSPTDNIQEGGGPPWDITKTPESVLIPVHVQVSLHTGCIRCGIQDKPDPLYILGPAPDGNGIWGLPWTLFQGILRGDPGRSYATHDLKCSLGHSHHTLGDSSHYNGGGQRGTRKDGAGSGSVLLCEPQYHWFSLAGEVAAVFWLPHITIQLVWPTKKHVEYGEHGIPALPHTWCIFGGGVLATCERDRLIIPRAAVVLCEVPEVWYGSVGGFPHSVPPK